MEMKQKDIENAATELAKKKRPKKSEQMAVQAKPGDMRKYMRHSLAAWYLPEIDVADINQVNERIEWYFNHCIEDDMKPTVMGLCNALGISRDTFHQWCTGNSRKDTHTDSIKKAKDFLEEMMESYMLNGKINPVSGIFLLKNNFGYQDKTEMVVTPNNPLGNQTDPEELKRKYIEATIPGDSDNDS